MVSDLISLIVGITAMRLARRKETDANTFGFVRAEVLGGLINSVFLLSVVFFICLEAIQRFIEAEPIDDPLIVLGVGIGGLIVNLIGLCMLFQHRSLAVGHGHSHSHGADGAEQSADDGSHNDEDGKKASMNLHGVFLHVLGDAIGSVAVVVSALLSHFIEQDWVKYADPALSLFLACIIAKSSWPLFRASVRILMQSVPGEFA